MVDKTFSKLSDDVVLKILFLLEDDPRSWARLSCVSSKFSALISTVCCKSKCISTLPSLSADLLSLPSSSTGGGDGGDGGGGWSSLYKIAVCCPGLLHSGVLLDNSDFGLLRELGPDEDYHTTTTTATATTTTIINSNKNTRPDPRVCEGQASREVVTVENNEHEAWTMYDDLYFDTVYDNSETTPTSSESSSATITSTTITTTNSTTPVADDTATGVVVADDDSDTKFVVTNEGEAKKRKVVVLPTSSSSRLLRSHLASGVWNLSREQGNKLLASRFREDCLYVSDWPGCVHMEEKRSYMLFRGVFKNFKRSRVWRTINDGQRSKVDLNCAFCGCKNNWDLHSAFCLKRGFGFHDDGEPVVRAYVCENGHVSGAWTDLPLYS